MKEASPNSDTHRDGVVVRIHHRIKNNIHSIASDEGTTCILAFEV